MKQISLIIGLVMCIALNANTQGILLKDSTSIATMVDSVVNNNFKENKIPGAVISVVFKGQVVYNKGFGVENTETNRGINATTSRFRVASITKTFTALAIMQLVEQGKLDLYADIHKYLPSSEYQFDAPYSFTIHDLLTHTAGFEWSSVRVSEEAKADDLLETFVKTSMNKQIFEPGDVFYYSNKGYGILGHLIEKMSGMKYQDYIDQKILPVLGMNHSTSYQHTADSPLSDIVTPYRWKENGYVEIPRQIVANPAASTLNTTGQDMARFMIAMMNKTQSTFGRVLSESTFDMMSDTQFESLVPNQGMAYGMGVGDYRGYRSLSHGGGIEGFGSYYTFYPELDLGIFMVESGGESNAGFVFKNIFDALSVLVEEKENVNINLAGIDVEEQAKKCEGRYQMITVTQSTFEKGRRIFGIEELNIKHIGDGRLQAGNRMYAPIGELIYEEEGQGSRNIGFKLDKEGQVQYFGNGSLYTTYEKIKWFKSYVALQIALGIGLLLVIVLLVIRPFYRKFKKISPPSEFFTSQRMSWTVGLLLGGFIILLIGNVLDLRMTTGTHIGYKIGLVILTIGALMSALIPYDLFKIWRSAGTPVREKIYCSVGLLGLALICVCFWDINLIGMNWY